MLTDEQVNAIAKCIELGGQTKFDFNDAPLCDAIDSIINHLESQRMEESLFKRINVQELPEPGELKPMTPEEVHHAFVHHAMHWAFQLGVGAALFAVGHDISGDTIE